MAASAWKIERHQEKFGSAGGGSAGPITNNTLTITFRVSYSGPTHVCGIMCSDDGWITNEVVEGTFVEHSGDYGKPGSVEHWKVDANNIKSPFEYILFCHDHKGVQGRETIYDTNEGQCYRFVYPA